MRLRFLMDLLLFFEAGPSLLFPFVFSVLSLSHLHLLSFDCHPVFRIVRSCLLVIWFSVFFINPFCFAK